MKTIDQSALQPLLNLYKEAVTSQDNAVVKRLETADDQLSWVENIVDGWKTHNRFTDLMFTFFRPIVICGPSTPIYTL